MKRIIIFALAAVMLTGCGGGKKKDNEPVVTHPKATMTGDGVMVEEDDDIPEDEDGEASDD